jgi:asparagine synthase (glutamine-hydrolysing)
MSGLAGVWNFDGRPVERDLVATIGSRIAHRGEDAAGLWCVQGLGFSAHVRRFARHSTNERQPVTDEAGNALVFDGRLDNRDDLLRQLPATAITSESADADVVFEAFRAWGDACLDRLAGDFALAAFHARERRLVLARDPVGCRPLYFWCDGKTFVFGSEIKALLAHPSVRAEPNQDLLADFFLCDSLPYEDEGETFFQNISAVLPGYRLNVSSRGISSGRFWDFDPQIQIRYGSYTDYAARLRELLIQAVKRRLRSNEPAAIAVSGGLDSSAVLCIADDLRKSGDINAPLLPISYVVNEDQRSDEHRFLRVLESMRHLQVDRVLVRPPGDREPDEPSVRHSEWPRFDEEWVARQPMLARATSAGARTVMTGHWSDQLFFVTGFLNDLFVRFAWRQISRHLREYSRWFVDADPAYFRSRFRRELLLNLTPHQCRAWFRPFINTASPSGLRLVRPEFAARLNRRRPRTRRPRSASAHAGDIYRFVRAKSHRLQFEADEKLGASCGVESVTPFLDRDLIAYLMSIPGDIQNHNGVPRALLRDSMRGIVPGVILERRWRDDGLDLARDRERVYLSGATSLEASSRLGLLRDSLTVDRTPLEFLGLEFWSRVFFSDTLAPPFPSAHGVNDAMDTVVTPGKDDRERLPYSPPKLTVHGDLRTITAAKQSDRSEAGQPKTFSGGMP